MKKILSFTVTTLVLLAKTSFPQSGIQPNFNSSNGWMPDYIGDTNPPLSSPGPSINSTDYTTIRAGLFIVYLRLTRRLSATFQPKD